MPFGIFNLISTPFSFFLHQAILELTQVKGFQIDSRWIARRPGISVDEVNVALQRLLRLGSQIAPAGDEMAVVTDSAPL